MDFGLMFYRAASRATKWRVDNARWYDPSLGRLCEASRRDAQADTIVPGGVQGLDRYAYVNNSPMNYVDPSGHEAVVTFTGAGWNYFENILDGKLDDARDSADDAANHAIAIGAGIGALIGLACGPAFFACSPVATGIVTVVGAVGGTYLGSEIGNSSPQQSYLEELEKVVRMIDLWVAEIEMENAAEGDGTGFEVAIIFNDGHDENGNFYQVLINEEWVDVSRDVYETLQETFSDKKPQDDNQSNYHEFDGMIRMASKSILEY